MTQNQIQQEISKYDFGSIIRPQEFMDKFTPEALKISVRSYRQYNFFEAGLPVIISDRLKYFSKILKDNKIGFSVSDNDLDDLNKIISNYDYEELRKNVLKKREEFLIDNHVDRLNNFYSTAIEKGI